MSKLPIGTGLVFAGKRVMVPGVNVINFLDDPDLALDLPEDGRRRRPGTSVQMVALHTTRGAPDRDDPRAQTIIPGFGPSTRAGYEVVHDQRRNGKNAGEHIVIDHDGVVYQLCDIVTVTSYNATTINDRCVGIEMKQGSKHNEIYVEAVGSLIAVLDVITAELGIPRCIPQGYHGPLKRLEAGGRDYWGVLGHRDQTSNRSVGDPGDYIMAAVAAAGYRWVDIARREDIEIVTQLQRDLGFRPSSCDGVPGPLTRYALAKAGYAHGLWTCPPEILSAA